jgi:hypothetical protein
MMMACTPMVMSRKTMLGSVTMSRISSMKEMFIVSKVALAVCRVTG